MVVDDFYQGVTQVVRGSDLLDSTPRQICLQQALGYASPEYIARRGRPLSPPDLERHDCLTFRLSEAGIIWRAGADVWALDGPAGAFEVPARGPLKASSADVLVRAAVSGLGLVLVLDWLVDHHVATGRLVSVLDDYRVMHQAGDGAIYAVYPSGRYVSAKVRVFLDHMVEYFSQALSSGEHG